MIFSKKRHLIATCFQKITYWPTYFILYLLFGYEVSGRGNLDGLEDKALIFASNHASYIDGPVSGVSLPYKFLPVHFLAAEMFYKKARFLPFAAYLFLSGSIKIPQEPKGVLPILLKEAVGDLKSGHRVWIYPEGKRSRDGSIGKGKPGVTYLHEVTRAPIVPVYIKGTFRPLAGGRLFKRIPIRVTIGRPLYHLRGETYYEEADYVMEEVKRLMNS